MKAATSQPSLFGPACERCPAADCYDRDDIERACVQVELQSLDHAGLTHLSPDLPALLDQLHDFRLPDRLPRPSARALPPYLPQVEPHTPMLEQMPRTTALALSEFISKGGRKYEAGIRKALSLRSRGASAVVLVGTSTDPQLEAVWKQPEVFVDAIRRAEIDLVLGPALSIYVGRPSIERLANRSRNLYLYRCLSDGGVQAIPAVGFVDAIEATYVGNWIARLDLRSIFVDLQSADTPASWNLVREALPALITQARSIERIIVNGVAQPDRVSDLAQLTEPVELILTNANAFQLARSGHDYFVNGDRFVKRRSGERPEHLFSNFVRFYGNAAARRGDRYVPLSLQPGLL